MKTLLPGLLSLMLLAPLGAAQNRTDDKVDNKADDALARTLKDADAIFTAKIGKLNPLGQTNSIPPSTASLPAGLPPCFTSPSGA